MLDWLIIGGGPHGVHLAIRLIGEAGIEPATIRIVDPGPALMDTWQRCTANTGMTHLRSPCVHHLDLNPFSLKKFAETPEARALPGKTFARPYNRPSLPLFRAHCDMVMDRYGVADLHLQDRATKVDLQKDGAEVTLESGETLRSQQVLLAVGASEQPRRPAWSIRLHDRRTCHIFEADFSLDPEDWPQRVAVIGAGITAAQAALRLADAGKQVTLVARHALRKHVFDSDPGWVGPKSMTRFSKTVDPTARRRMITDARHRGSVPPGVYRRIRQAIRDGRVDLVRGEVQESRECEGGVRLEVTGCSLEVDRVLLATGFEPRRPGGTLVDDLAVGADLPCAACGFPLVDKHLRWHPRLFVTGALAELELGPVARNLIGARRAAERIVPLVLGRGR